MQTNETKFTWPEIFMSEDIRGLSDSQICAEGLCGWAICMAGGPPPESFGRVMILIGDKLGIIATPENLSKYAKEMIKRKHDEN